MKEKIFEHAWSYFQLHSQQRITLFNYYITISTIICTAIGYCYQSTAREEYLKIGIFLSIFLLILTFIFWKFDQRTSFLIKHSERILKEIEAENFETSLYLFKVESESVLKENLNKECILCKIWTYGTSFRVIFLLMALLSIAAIFFGFRLGFIEHSGVSSLGSLLQK